MKSKRKPRRKLFIIWTMSVVTILLASTIWCHAAQVVPGVQMAVSAPVQQPMFAPALTAIAPPTPKTNLFYNIGLVWDAEANPLITGYRIRYGTNTTTAFTNVMDVVSRVLTNAATAATTFCTVSNLAYKPTWFFQAFTLYGTNVSEGSNILQIQPPIEAGFVLSAVFPLYSSSDAVNWITNKVVTLVQTNPPGNTFFRSHFWQLEYQWTNNQIRLKPFPAL